MDKKLEEANLQCDTALLFKQIAAATAESPAAMSKELQKVTSAFGTFTSADCRHFNPVAALLTEVPNI